MSYWMQSFAGARNCIKLLVRWLVKAESPFFHHVEKRETHLRARGLRTVRRDFLMF